MDGTLGLLLTASLATVALAGENCWNGDRFEYCSNGCCVDSDNNHQCCDVLVWAIVVGVIGGIIFIGIIICLCCVFLKKVNKGQVITQPQNQTQISTVQYGQMYNSYPVGHQHPPPMVPPTAPPPPFQQQYGPQFPQYSDPVYPPVR